MRKLISALVLLSVFTILGLSSVAFSKEKCVKRSDLNIRAWSTHYSYSAKAHRLVIEAFPLEHKAGSKQRVGGDKFWKRWKELGHAQNFRDTAERKWQKERNRAEGTTRERKLAKRYYTKSKEFYDKAYELCYIYWELDQND